VTTCPNGSEVGNPPTIATCGLTCAECRCQQLLWGYAFGVTTPATFRTVHYWQAYPENVADGGTPDEDA
jgi:hypothetical protein